MKYQKGFTLTELLFTLWFVFCGLAYLGLISVIVYVAAHFISKFW